MSRFAIEEDPGARGNFGCGAHEVSAVTGLADHGDRRLSKRVRGLAAKVEMRSVRSSIVIIAGVVLALLATAVLPHAALGHADVTTVGELSLYPALENIGVIAAYSGDENKDNSASFFYREAGSTRWIPGVAMTVDRRDEVTYYPGDGDSLATVPNPWAHQARAVIFGHGGRLLAPDTEYEVKVTFSDPDGVSGGSSVIGTARTRSDDPPSTGRTLWVSPEGNDSSGDGSQSLPWATISHAASQVAAGERVMVAPGDYPEEIMVTGLNGLPDNYITFESQIPLGATIDGGSGERAYGFRLHSSNYVRLKGFHYLRQGRCGVRAEDSTGIMIDGSDFEDGGESGSWASGGIRISDVANFDIVDNVIRRIGEPDGGLFPILIEDAQGQFVGQGGHTIKGNEMYGGFEDAIGTRGVSALRYLWYGTIANTFIYDNHAHDIPKDDGLEIEGTNVNVAVFNNRVYNIGIEGIGLAPVVVGPMYVLRNELVDTGEGALKTGSDAEGHTYVYHNTMYQSTSGDGPANYGSTRAVYNQIYKNNIIVVDDTAMRFAAPSARGDPGMAGSPTHEIDYNLYQANSGSQKFRWEDVYCTSFEEWQAQGNDLNGIYDDPQWVNAGEGNFALQATSPGIDAGVVLPGINDANSPWPYQGAAPDLGSHEYPTYQLVVESEYGRPGGEGRYDSGRMATFSVPIVVDHADGSRHVFIGWRGDSTAATPSAPLVMDKDYAVEAEWQLQYHLSVGVTPRVIGDVGGEGWYDEGTTATTHAPPTISGDTGTQYVFVGWTLDGTKMEGDSVQIDMNSPHGAVAEYKEQYYLTVESAHGDPRGGGWYDSGSTAEVRVGSPSGWIVRQSFDGWEGDVVASEPKADVLVDRPKTVTAIWSADYVRLYVIVGLTALLAVAALGILLGILIIRRRKV